MGDYAITSLTTNLKKVSIIIVGVFIISSCQSQSNNTYDDPNETARILGGLDSLHSCLSTLKVEINCDSSDMKTYVKVVIDETGSPINMKIVEPSKKCESIDSIALEVVKTMKFIPAKKEGKPYETSLIIPIKLGRD